MILTSQKFYYGPGRYRTNHAHETADGHKEVSKWKKERPSLSNYNSVRVSTPHKKFVTLELFSPTQTAIRFNRFYCDELKHKVQLIQNAKFMMDYRAWIIETKIYK